MVSHDFPMVFLWFSDGFPMIFVWFLMIFRWFSYDFPMVSHDFPLVFLWFSYGFPMIFVWFSYDFPMVFLWFSYGFPLFSYGFPMIFLWFPMIFLWFLWFLYIPFLLGLRLSTSAELGVPRYPSTWRWWWSLQRAPPGLAETINGRGESWGGRSWGFLQCGARVSGNCSYSYYFSVIWTCPKKWRIPKIDDFEWKSLLRWMIWRYPFQETSKLGIEPWKIIGTWIFYGILPAKYEEITI